MKIKKYTALLLAALMLLLCVSCGKTSEPAEIIEPDEGRLKSICQLSVLEGYFHNVVKYRKSNPDRLFLKSNDTHFWVEYTGVAKYGVDASKVTLEMSGNEITITLPKAHMLYCKVDSTSLDENSFTSSPLLSYTETVAVTVRVPPTISGSITTLIYPSSTPSAAI